MTASGGKGISRAGGYRALRIAVCLLLSLILAVGYTPIYAYADEGDEPQAEEPGGDSGNEGPGADDPGTDVPGGDSPGADTPGGDTPGGDDPGTDTPGGDVPGGDDPGTDTPGGDTPGTDTPGTDTPGTDTPGGTDVPGEGDEGGDSPGDDGPGEGSDTPANYINDVAIFYHNEGVNPLATSFVPNMRTASISAKSGTLEFDSVIYWRPSNDQDRNAASRVAWHSSDPSIAGFDGNTGVLRAYADGTVEIWVEVTSDTREGRQVIAKTTVTVTGQEDAPYVKSLRIISPDGRDITDRSWKLEEDLSTAQAQLIARVEVYDPASKETRTVLTSAGSLSSQVPELGELAWHVGDTSLASIVEETGLFRPAKYAPVSVVVESYAGEGNARVAAETVVNAVNPNPEEQVEEGYFPQPSLTVKVFYELDPPEVHGEDAYVVQQTYSVGELSALGLVTASYTSVGSNGGYYTLMGTGTPLSAVMRDVGIDDMGAILSFSFTTADWPSGRNRSVTAGFVFANRYFFPEFNMAGSTDNAVQVYPIIALVSSQMKNSVNVSAASMTEGTRFRLLFGSMGSDGSSQYQVKWINTLYVELAGARPTEPESPAPPKKHDDNESDDRDKDKPEGDKNTEGEGDQSDTQSTGEEGDQAGSDKGDASKDEHGTGDDDRDPADAPGETGGPAQSAGLQRIDGQTPEEGELRNGSETGVAASEANEQEQDPDQPDEQADEALVPDEVGYIPSDKPAGKSSVYQIMSSYEAVGEDKIDRTSPLRPYALPLGGLAVAVGGVESFLWFRFQTRKALGAKA